MFWRQRPAATKRVTFLGHFGAGNLGNECTLQAAIQQISIHLPQAYLQCACTDPEDVRRRHHVPAYPWKRPSSFSSDSATGMAAVARSRPTVFVRLFEELTSYVVCLRVLWRSDILIVCGTNLVSDYLTGAKGWPYDLFKWSGLAALLRVRVLFLGIGVGPIDHPMSQWLIKRSLGFADFRSYRDEISRQCAEKSGFNTDRDVICPDLVFGLSERLLSPKIARSGPRPVIGLGLKDYKSDFDAASQGEYRNYIGTMAAFVRSLCESGYDVRLLIGDLSYDTNVRRDVVAALGEQVAGQDRVLADPALTVEDLIGHIAETDVLISPRFHNLVFALLLNKPVIALSDHHKIDALMQSFALSEYCLPLDSLGADALSDLFQRVRDASPQLKAHIRAKVAESRTAVSEQYEAALAAAGASPQTSSQLGTATSLGT